MTIIKRLLITLTVALLALIAVGSYGILQQSQANERFDYLKANTFPSIKDLDDAKDAYYSIRAGSLRYSLFTDSAKRGELESAIADNEKKFDQAMAIYEKDLISDDTDRKMLGVDRADMAAFRAVRLKYIELARANNMDGARAALAGEFATTGDALIKDLTDHIGYNYKLADSLSEANKQAYAWARMSSIGAIIVALLLTGALAGHLLHIIKSSLAGIRHTLQKVSQTLDFTLRAPVPRMDEVGHTATAFNDLLARLQQNLKSIMQGAQEVASASQQLAQTASQVSTSAEAQSTSSASMAATVEQMTVGVNHVAERAKEARGMTEDAGKLAEEGSATISQTIHDIHDISRAVEQAAGSIRELGSYSEQVSNVVQVIRDIADQINLLALNAAIEAARAGEQGRGFAVVADEVRKLAERTATSTQEITVTIESMRSRSQQATEQMQTAEQLVGNGVARADGADHAIKRIGESSHGTVEIVGEISAAIHEQGVASNNIAQQVERIAQMTEESSAAALQTASSAARLDELARTQIATLQHYAL